MTEIEMLSKLMFYKLFGGYWITFIITNESEWKIYVIPITNDLHCCVIVGATTTYHSI